MPTREEELGFGWLIPHALAASGLPSSDDFPWIKAKGIGAIVSVVDVELDAAALKTLGIDWLHVHCFDGEAPKNEEFDRIVAFIDSSRDHGRAVLVHCFAGIGRTSTALAAYFIAKRKMTAADAADEVVRKRWGGDQSARGNLTARQIDALDRYAIARLKHS